MQRSLRFFVLLAVSLCVTLAFQAATPAPASAATETVVSDTFESLDATLWTPQFFRWNGTSSDPSTGLWGFGDGFLALRPDLARGISALEADRSLITTLPAHVSFRIRYTLSGFREADVMLTSQPVGAHFTLPAPSVLLKLGNTSYSYQRHPYLDVYPAGGGSSSSEHPLATVLPTGSWIDCDIWLNADRVRATFNGVDLTTLADIDRIVDAGGLGLVFQTNDDYARGGFDIDDVLVEQAAEDEPPASDEETPAPMPENAHVRGVVKDSITASPVAGVRVRAFAEENGVVPALATSTVTAPDGTYDLALEDGGFFGISFDDEAGRYRDELYPGSGLPLGWTRAVYVEPGEELGGIDASLTPVAWARDHRAVRVSGADRYQTALAVSRTNFASADTAVLACGTGFADACAASPLCGAYRAPLLLTRTTALPAGVLDELKRLKVKRVFVVGSSSVVSEGVLETLRGAGVSVTRLAGADRYETAAAIVDYLLLEDVELAEVPFVVRGDLFPDALAVAPFAYADVRPVVLVRPGSAPAASVSLLARLETDTVIVVGSPSAVGTGALEDLADGTGSGSLSAHRVSGADRYETAAAVVRFWGRPFDRLAIATGVDFPDALTGGVAMGERGGALLLSRPASVPSGVAGVVSLNGTYLWPVQVFGSGLAIGAPVLDSVASAAGKSFFEHETFLQPGGMSPLRSEPTTERPRIGLPQDLRFDSVP